MPRMEPAQAVGLTLTTIGTAVGLFGQTMPSQQSLAAAPADAGTLAWTRRKATTTAMMVGAIGIGASLLAGSPWPALGAAGVAAYLWHSYCEAALVDAAVRL